MRMYRSKPEKRSEQRRPKLSERAQDPWRCEADVVEGLEAIAADELRRRLGQDASLQPSPRPGVVPFDYSGPLVALLQLKTIQSVYLVLRFAVPRPRALLGDQHFRNLLACIAAVRSLHPPGAFRTLYVSAAGSESAVMTRLKEELARHTGLEIARDEGDLMLRVRRPFERGEGWEVLVRLSPRPLATRAWRVCNLEGALNATVAHAMILLAKPRPQEIVLNPACGSGTLLVERLAASAAGRLIGCDTSPHALACARANVSAAGSSDRIELYPWDARALPLPERSVDVLYSDLPFGQLVGSHRENIQLYPLILQEAARVARQAAPFVVITQEVRLLETLLAEQQVWALEEVLRVSLGSTYPRIFVLRRQ